jgi:thiol-disulfide isomerase/thioredoxin
MFSCHGAVRETQGGYIVMGLAGRAERQPRRGICRCHRFRGRRYFALILGLILSGAAASDAAGLALGDPVPDFTYTLFSANGRAGSAQRLSDLRGKPVVLNFWAGQCPPCRVEMPEFQGFYEDFQARIAVLGIDVGAFTDLGSRDDARRLVTELGVSYPTGFTEDQRVIKLYQVYAMPTTIFIDANGKLVKRWNGVLNRDALTAMAEHLLQR